MDITGLPPTPAERQAFVSDSRPDAYKRLIDRLLISPAYGERWGRHLMDIWRYSDWAGWNDGGQVRDSQPHIWRWRDWIVESLNGNMPYDRMVTLMLAADEVAPTDQNALRATGFLVRNYKLLSLGCQSDQVALGPELPEWLPPISNSNTLGIPNTFWLLILVAAVLWVVLHRSVFGRHLIAVGRSEDAARYAGINANSVIMKAYIICGVLTGVAAILLAFFTNTVGPATHGNSYELYGIAAAVLGGCSLRGGEGSIVGVVLGATLLRVLQNLVTLLHIPSSLEFAVTGAVIMAGVLTDEILRRRRKA
jgi:ABC-type xylose transport system permease subunit